MWFVRVLKKVNGHSVDFMCGYQAKKTHGNGVWSVDLGPSSTHALFIKPEARNNVQLMNSTRMPGCLRMRRTLTPVKMVVKSVNLGEKIAVPRESSLNATCRDACWVCVFRCYCWMLDKWCSCKEEFRSADEEISEVNSFMGITGGAEFKWGGLGLNTKVGRFPNVVFVLQKIFL